MPDHSENTSSLVAFIIFTIAYLGISYIGLFHNVARGMLPKIIFPITILTCIGMALFFWSKINFGTQILAGFNEALILVSFFLVYLIATTVISYKASKYEFFSVPIVIFLFTLFNIINNKWNSYNDLNTEKFTQRYPDYVKALQTGNPNEISPLIEKHKKDDLSEVFIIHYLKNAKPETFQLLLERDVISEFSMPSVINTLHSQKTTIDANLIILFVNKAFENQNPIRIKSLFENFTRSYQKMTTPEIKTFLDTVKLFNLDKSLLSSNIAGTTTYSGSTGFILDTLNTFERYAFADEKLEDYKSSIEKTLFVLMYLWESQDYFITHEELPHFRSTINRSRHLIQTNNDLSKKDHSIYFQTKITMLEDYLNKLTQ